MSTTIEQAKNRLLWATATQNFLGGGQSNLTLLKEGGFLSILYKGDIRTFRAEEYSEIVSEIIAGILDGHYDNTFKEMDWINDC